MCKVYYGIGSNPCIVTLVLCTSNNIYILGRNIIRREKNGGGLYRKERMATG